MQARSTTFLLRAFITPQYTLNTVLIVIKGHAGTKYDIFASLGAQEQGEVLQQTKKKKDMPYSSVT
jgi:hypothetical protein